MCATEELYADGSFYIADCTVNGTAVDYTYGERQITQVYKPQYYYFGLDWRGTVGTTAAPSEAERLTVPPTGEIRYLGYDVADGKVSAAYACFTRNGTEYCLKGYDTEAFATNNTILEEAFGASACSFVGGGSSCRAEGLDVNATSSGYADAIDGSVDCYVGGVGNFGCRG